MRGRSRPWTDPAFAPLKPGYAAREAALLHQHGEPKFDPIAGTVVSRAISNSMEAAMDDGA